MAGTVGEYDDEHGDPHCGGQGYSFLPNGHPYCERAVVARRHRRRRLSIANSVVVKLRHLDGGVPTCRGTGTTCL
jgi:hypothetical protein